MTLTTAPSDTLRPAGALAAATLCAAFQQTAAARADDVAIRTPGDATTVRWSTYAERVRRIAEGLHGLGVRPGDAVALLLTKRPEFHLVDTAALHIGAVPFSIYDVYAPGQVAEIVTDAGARVVVTDAPGRAKLPSGVAEQVVVIDGAHPLADLERRRSAGFDFDATWRAVTPDDLATLIYTSGTTGPSKAIELTHGALMRGWRTLQAAWRLEPGGRVVSYGSSAHISDRVTAHYGSMVLGLTVTCCAGAPAAIGVLPEVRPSVLFAVPPAWAALRARIEAAVRDGERQRFDDAMELGRRRLAARQGGEVLPADVESAWAHADAEVLARVRERAGLASTLCLVGGAPAPADVFEFFHALGVALGETYGMSEIASLITFDPRDEVRLGTVGRALPGIELRVDGIGEILVRCESLMRGYRNRPDATATAIDTDGWLHTGDLGVLDADGYLRLSGRLKELIINCAGDNMSPSAIEATLRAECPLLAHVCVFGDARPYNVALATLAGPVDAAARAAVVAAVNRANARLSTPERIERHLVLDDVWAPGSDVLTPTMKPRRAAIATRYAAEIEALYR